MVDAPDQQHPADRPGRRCRRPVTGRPAPERARCRRGPGRRSRRGRRSPSPSRAGRSADSPRGVGQPHQQVAQRRPPALLLPVAAVRSQSRMLRRPVQRISSAATSQIQATASRRRGCAAWAVARRADWTAVRHVRTRSRCKGSSSRVRSASRTMPAAAQHSGSAGRGSRCSPRTSAANGAVAGGVLAEAQRGHRHHARHRAPPSSRSGRASAPRNGQRRGQVLGPEEHPRQRAEQHGARAARAAVAEPGRRRPAGRRRGVGRARCRQSRHSLCATSASAVQQPPDDEAPGGPVPQPAHQHRHHQVRGGARAVDRREPPSG